MRLILEYEIMITDRQGSLRFPVSQSSSVLVPRLATGVPPRCLRVVRISSEHHLIAVGYYLCVESVRVGLQTYSLAASPRSFETLISDLWFTVSEQERGTVLFG